MTTTTSSSTTSASARTDFAAPLCTKEFKAKLRDGTSVLIRPIHAEDEQLERRFIEGLSKETRRLRFLGEINTPSDALLNSLTHPDPGRDAAFIALIADGAEKREIGVARFCGNVQGSACECAVVVTDEWQHLGLATILMQHLINVARERGIDTMYSIDGAENNGMHDLAAHLGFTRSVDPDDAAQTLHSLDLRMPTV